MSKEQHPNLHAVGLLTDVLAAIEIRLRGDAAALGVYHKSYRCIASTVMEFVVQVEKVIDGHTEELKGT